MYAIVDIKGKQFKVEKNQTINVPKLNQKIGTKVEFDNILLSNDKGKVSTKSKLKVIAKVISHNFEDKVIVFKKKRRKGYRVKNGHKQHLSEILIESISNIKTVKNKNVKKATPSESNSRKLKSKENNDKPDLKSKSLLELKDIAKKKKISGYSSMKKNDLIKNAKVLPLCGTVEQEISLLNEQEKQLFLEEYNQKEPGLNKVIRESFSLLGLHNFFTCGAEEVKAWTIPYNVTAPEAAGKIHSDFQRGFIKADVFSCDDLFRHRSEKSLREKGLIRQEGKEYVINDGDCVFFKFNV